jgi:peptidoglycan/LPS O-acetylase OafA/YrhL
VAELAASRTVGRRLSGIDILRGLSIVAVVLHHENLRMMFSDLSFENWLPKQLGKILFWNGANGVTVFFAISGFLITTTALSRWNSLANISLPGFYRLRFARIAPLLLTLLAVLSSLHLTHVKGFVIDTEKTSLGRAVLAALTFHMNWLESMRGYLPGSWDVLWSLSVEEMFYLFFPVLCVFTRRLTVLIPILFAFVLTGPFARTILTRNELWKDYGYLSCMDCIALGCLSALLVRHWQPARATLRTLQIAGAALMLLVTAARPLAHWMRLYELGLDVTALALGTCLVMIAIAVQDKPARSASAPLRWFGRNSYEVYLTHMFIVMWATQSFVALALPVAAGPAWYMMVLILSGLLGAGVARWYSEPLNRWLRQGMRFGDRAGTKFSTAERPSSE